MRRLFGGDCLGHQIGRVGLLAVDAGLFGEGAVSFYDVGAWDAGLAVEAVDVLGEVFEEEVVGVEELDETVGYCGAEFAWVEFWGGWSVSLLAFQNPQSYCCPCFGGCQKKGKKRQREGHKPFASK